MRMLGHPPSSTGVVKRRAGRKKQEQARTSKHKPGKASTIAVLRWGGRVGRGKMRRAVRKRNQKQGGKEH